MYDYSEEITDYIYKQMSELQREAFEKRLELDEELAAEVARQQQMLDTMQAAMVYKEVMEDPHREEAERIAEEIVAAREKKAQTKQKTRRIITVRLISIAAGFLILFLLDFITYGLTPLSGIRKKMQANLGFKTEITRGFGRRIGRRLAKILGRIPKN